MLKTTIANGVAIVPGEQAREILLDVLQSIFTSAVHEGERIATGTENRSMPSAAMNVAGRAVQLISDIVSHIKEKVKSLIESLSGASAVQDRDIQDGLKEWADLYAQGLAGDEVHDLVEEEVLNGLKQAGVEMVICITEGDDRVCALCQTNKEQGPIPIGTPFTSGQRHSPFHKKCRCNVGRA